MARHRGQCGDQQHEWGKLDIHSQQRFELQRAVGDYYRFVTTNLSFSGFLGLTNETGPNGDSLGIGYDAAARPATTTSPYGAVTGFTYNDTASPPTHIAITNGHGTRTTLDGFGRTIKVETGTGTATNFTVVSTVDSVYGSCGCSPLGKLTQTSMPYAPGGTEVYTTYTYDGLGRTLTQTAPDGSVTTYAYAGSSVSVTDPAGKWKQYYMDTLGNVSMVVEPNPVANPTSPPAWAFTPSLSNVTYHVTSYSYDVLNHLTQVSMPRYNASTQVTTTQTRTFNYTSSNVVGALLLSATNPENGTVTYTYNTNNQIATKTDAKDQQTQLTYDSYNRVMEVQHFYYQSGGYVEDASQRVNYTYDSGTYGQGRLTGITYQPMANSLVSSTLPTFSEAYTYTQPGSVASKQLSIAQTGYSGLSLTGSWTYDNEGKMTSVTYPSVSNHSGTYTTSFDGLARPSFFQRHVPTDPPDNVPLLNTAKPDQQAKFKRAFKNAENRLRKNGGDNDCADDVGKTTDESIEDLIGIFESASYEYNYIPGTPATTPAQTDPLTGTVTINAGGGFMADASWSLYGVTLSAGDFGAFTLLHELGHLTGAAPNDSDLNDDISAAFNMAILRDCFGKNPH